MRVEQGTANQKPFGVERLLNILGIDCADDAIGIGCFTPDLAA